MFCVLGENLGADSGSWISRVMNQAGSKLKPAMSTSRPRTAVIIMIDRWSRPPRLPTSK